VLVRVLLELIDKENFHLLCFRPLSFAHIMLTHNLFSFHCEKVYYWKFTFLFMSCVALIFPKASLIQRLSIQYHSFTSIFFLINTKCYKQNTLYVSGCASEWKSLNDDDNGDDNNDLWLFMSICKFIVQTKNYFSLNLSLAPDWNFYYVLFGSRFCLFNLKFCTWCRFLNYYYTHRQHQQQQHWKVVS
jgi:hypothetical protein